jgi:hypothetical protein
LDADPKGEKLVLGADSNGELDDFGIDPKGDVLEFVVDPGIDPKGDVLELVVDPNGDVVGDLDSDSTNAELCFVVDPKGELDCFDSKGNDEPLVTRGWN